MKTPGITVWISAYFFLLNLSAAPATNPDEICSLSGTWRFQLDPENQGISEGWYSADLTETIQLPGSVGDAVAGRPATEIRWGGLTAQNEYVGRAWYQRTITIPDAWHWKPVRLFLERCLWESTVWIDDRRVGSENSLTTPHEYALGVLRPGEHRLTICVDNALIENIGISGHAYTEHTQSLWNGIVGRLELRAMDAIGIAGVRVYPDADRKNVRVKLLLRNKQDAQSSASWTATVTSENDGEIIGRSEGRFAAVPSTDEIELYIQLTKTPRLWDEFSPALYRLDLTMRAGGFAVQPEESLSGESVRFGFRTIQTEKRSLTINKRRISLRGNLDCCIFPLTGYPPTTVEEWTRLLTILKDYGMNHLRFHTWCPPEAAFTAADSLGVYLQAETPLWISQWMTELDSKLKLFGQDPGVVAFIRSELNRIVDAYGNHPSFCMLSIGNEIANDSDYELLNELIADMKVYDPRRLYAASSARKLNPADEYFVTHATPGGAVRGLGPAHTDWDFEKAAASVDRPVIAHEIGQWAVYPEYAQIEKYKGNLKPRSLESFRDKLASRGMEGMDSAFQLASGRLALALYKHEIEAVLRTADMAGFQHLMLYDFPGQGEALVGLLDSFWDSKGIVPPEEFRRFCSSTVPLLRFPKYVWESGEVFSATASLSHFGPHDLPAAECEWSVTDSEARVVASGGFPAQDIKTGDITSVGRFETPLPTRQSGERLTVEMRIRDTPHANRWSIWVFPKQTPVTEEGVSIRRSFDADTDAVLKRGGKVLLVPPYKTQGKRLIQNQFKPVFWTYYSWTPSWKGWGAGTLGFLCDPRHPALRLFPTESHSDWQWKEILDRSTAFILDDAPADLQPIVQPIDDFHRNHRLGALVEGRLGKGRVLLCGFDICDDLDRRPSARQMRHSLIAYMQSDRFRPTYELDADWLRQLLLETDR